MGLLPVIVAIEPGNVTGEGGTVIVVKIDVVRVEAANVIVDGGRVRVVKLPWIDVVTFHCISVRL